jgi:hypothetical protein
VYHHGDERDVTPTPDEEAGATEERELTEAEGTAELDRLDAEHRAERAADRAQVRRWSHDMATHMVEELAALDPATRKAVSQYLTGLHMVALWIDQAAAGEALDAREAAQAAQRAAWEGGA